MREQWEFRVVVTAVSDGRVLLEWLHDRSHGRRAAEATVEDEKAIAETLQTWATERRPEPKIRYTLRQDVPRDLRDGVTLVTFTKTDDAELPEHARGGSAARFAYISSDFHQRMPVASTVDGFGASMARDVARSFRVTQGMAHARLADGAYLPVLEAYWDQLSTYTDPGDQRIDQVLRRELYPILDGEKYLALAKDERAREVLAKINRERASLYNWYMDLAKGGNSRPRGARRE